MARATSLILLICGSLLLVTWLVSPASSAPQASAPAPVVTDLGPLPAELAEVNAQLERLKTRLDRAVEAPSPSRDPFHFAEARPAERPSTMPAMPIEMMAPPVITPAWPTLVAILTAPEDGSLQAALSDRDETMFVVSAGGVVGAFTVTEIAPEAITVTDAATGQSTRLSLR